MKFIHYIHSEIQKGQNFGPKIALYDTARRVIKNEILYRKKHDLILKYLNNKYWHVIEKYKNINGNMSNIADNYPIWVFWYQGFNQAPALVQQCLESLKKNAGKHPVIELNRDNIRKYVKIPEYILEKVHAGKISITAFSDILRVSLLGKYGGCWSDATIYYDRWIDENLQKLSWYSLKRNPHNKDARYVSDYRWTSFFQICGKNSIIAQYTRDMLYSYWEEHDVLIDYLLIDYIIALGYQEIDAIKQLIDATPYSNPNIDWLSQNLNETYIETIYDTIRKNTALFKLNWRLKLTFDKDTYGKKLLIDMING